MLTIRRDHVVPLLGMAGGHCGTVLAGASGLVAVDWRLGDAMLCLRANFSDAVREAPPAAGRLLWSENRADAANGMLGPLSLLWTLRDGASPVAS